VSAAIVHDQQVLWAGAYGLADVASKRQAAANSIYSICSISKLFTSVAVLQQRDAGTLRLDDPVSQHLPWFKIGSIEEESGPVTIEGSSLTHLTSARIRLSVLDRANVRVSNARADHRTRIAPADAVSLETFCNIRILA
jgi:hypothetical protein